MAGGRELVLALLERAKQAVGVEFEVKLVLYPMKYKIASVSLKNNTIRLNRNLLEALDEDELYYILVHELIHVKQATLDHGEKFYEVLYKLFSPEEVKIVECRIVRKLIEAVNVKARAEGWLI